MSDEDCMWLAIEQAEIALREGNWPIGCVIELYGGIISQEHNRVYSLRDRTAHAEILALGKVQSKLEENKGIATLYTTYEPCPMCFGAAILSRVKRVVSGVDLD